MNERLIQFLKVHNLSSTRLADQIGVQRSSISHVVSGRNKPSYDFIYKFLQHYPRVNPRWLIMGEGSMYENQKQQGSLLFQQEEPGSTPRESTGEKSADPSPVIEDSQEEEQPAYGRKTRIERIVVFYSDKRFEEYRPDGDR
ncbi:MAG: helix-turn-helix transcriptional regulator [Bacteroidales bacterium]|nr:helix-turn-helix transcriptional regulator [Bacteroidales bacterium]